LPERYLIAGVGNTLRSDDGVGIKALEYLKERSGLRNFDFLEFATKSIDILNYIKEYAVTFIIDAVDFGAEVGQVRLFALENINLPVDENRVSSHSLSLKDLARLYKMLKIKSKVYIVGIQPGNLSYGQELSVEVLESFPEVLARIKGNKDGLCCKG